LTLREASAVQPLKVALEGVDGRARERLTRFLASISNDSCLVVDPEEAEVVLINVSDPASFSYEEFSQRSGVAPPVLLGRENPGIEERFFVQKPLKAQVLLRAIQSAQKLYWELTAGADEQTDEEVTFSDFEPAEVADLSHQPLRPAGGGGLYYDPDKGLTGLIASLVEQADAEGNAYLVDLGGGRYLLYNPDTKLVCSTIPDSDLKKLAESDEVDGTIRLAKAAHIELLESEREEKGIAEQSLSTLLWKTHAWHSAGRLPAGTEIDLRVTLERWPNFTALLRLAHDMRIAHLWIEQPLFFTETSALLDISGPSIYSFYSAASAAGLAHPAHREEDYLIAAEGSSTTVSGGFFGRLDGRFGRTRHSGS